MSKGQGLWEHDGDYCFGLLYDGLEFNLQNNHFVIYGGTDKGYDPGKYPTVNKRLSPKELVMWRTQVSSGIKIKTSTVVR